MVDAAKTGRGSTKALSSAAVTRSELARTHARSQTSRAEANGAKASGTVRDLSGSQPAVPGVSGTPSIFNILAYQRDVLERSILFFDTMRRRANNMLEHERAGLPPLLNFKYETLLDARQFDRPANYALLRITEVGDDCWDDCVDLTKPPVIVIDPRAGHGPGIGGFKRDSEVGIALHTGHPVYFVVFFPEPCKGQTLGCWEGVEIAGS